MYSSENGLTLGCESRIEYSGLCSAAFSLHGATSWLSSNEKPWSPGIALAFDCFWPLRSKPKTPGQAKARCRGSSSHPADAEGEFRLGRQDPKKTPVTGRRGTPGPPWSIQKRSRFSSPCRRQARPGEESSHRRLK